MPIGDLVYDVGLHTAEDTAYYLRKGYRVVAFEANPDLVQAARKTFAAEIAAGRLMLVEGAIADGDFDTPAVFYKDENTVWGTIVKSWADRNLTLGSRHTTITVGKVDFHRAMGEHGAPHFIKIDVEGMDRLCLDTLGRFEDRPAYVSIESDKVDFDALIAEFDALDALGYDAFKVVQQGGIGRRRVDPGRSLTGEPVTHRFVEGSSGPFGPDLPGPWLTRDQAIARYRRVFVMYRLFGDRGVLRHIPLSRLFFRALGRLINRSIPGWYDTHARHSGVSG